MQHRLRPIVLFGALLLGSCAERPEGFPHERASRVEQSILRGDPALSPAYDAVGALVASRTIFDQNIGAPRVVVTPFCTATLISPTVLLTAKHCVRTVDGTVTDPLVEVYYALGPDARKPVRKVPIAGAAAAPGDDGGFVHYGHDVGVVFLAEEVSGIEPLKLGQLKDRMVAKGFEAVGFGIRDAAINFGTRQKGVVKLSAVQGRVFEHALGDYAGFERWLTTDLLAHELPAQQTGTESQGLDGGLDDGQQTHEAARAGPLDTARQRYDETLLVPQYEAFVGGGADSAQPCSGDSGGPLLKDGTLYGVASGVLRTNKLVCDYGAVYATFGPDVMAFLKDALRKR